MRIILVPLLLLLSLNAFSQASDSLVKRRSVTIEVPPKFPGGPEGMYKVLENNFRYPKTALRDRVGGIVLTQFVVDTAGNVTDVKILEGVREDIDKESVRLIGLLQGWTPGFQDGKKVKVRYELPLTFSVEGQKNKQ